MQRDPEQESPVKGKPKEVSPQRIAQRKAMLTKLLRNKRQVEADSRLEEMIQNEEDIISAFKAHKFGAFCLQASDLERADRGIKKGLEVIEKRFGIFTNAYMNLGNLEAQKKDYKKAIEYYQKVIQQSPHQNPPEFQEKGIHIFSKQLNSYVAYVDAHTNMAVMYVQLDQFEKGFQLCKKSLELNPDSEAQVNFTDIMRQLGKKEEAIAHSWNQIEEYSRKNGQPDYKAPKPIKIQNWKPQENKVVPEQDRKVSVLTVKWGPRYDAEYLNKLYAGVMRNTTWKVTFYCFTDDGKGLHPDIKVEKLEEGWKRWWGKVTLFNAPIQGRKFYIDLDMVITGSLDTLFSYEGTFTTLRTGDLACEKNHKDGYNSSVMIWQGDELKPVYETLKENFDVITKFIVRFDFWLEMTIANADFCQALYPGIVIDFLADAKETLPEGSSVVCFARKPKPEDYPAPWIKQYWVL